jgi:hypothetical protein
LRETESVDPSCATAIRIVPSGEDKAIEPASNPAKIIVYPSRP